MAAQVLPFPDQSTDDDAPIFFERGDHAELAVQTLSLLGWDRLTFDAGEFWRYHPKGIWELVPSAKIRATVAGFAGSPIGAKNTPLNVSDGTAKGTESVLRDRLMCDDKRVTFDGAPVGAAFRNGFVRVSDGKVTVRANGAENRCRHFYDFEFDPRAETRKLQEFLDELFADCSEDERAARIALLQEFSGACLMGDSIRYQKCLILYGEGGNGKSSLLALLRSMFPKESLCSVPPHRWAERFGLASLEGKRANFVSETPSAEILDGGAFKAVVTGDEVTGERKHKDPFEFKPIAGHIFSMNWPLSSTDQSTGFWRRPIVLALSRRFDLDPSRRLGAEREVIEKEMPGVVAWAIEGAARAQRQGEFTMPDQSRTIIGEWRDNNDQVRMFLSERSDESGIIAGDFYAQYREWATSNGHRNMCTSRVFGLRVMATGAYERTDSHGKRIYKRKTTPEKASEDAARRALEQEANRMH